MKQTSSRRRWPNGWPNCESWEVILRVLRSETRAVSRPRSPIGSATPGCDAVRRDAMPSQTNCSICSRDRPDSRSGTLVVRGTSWLRVLRRGAIEPLCRPKNFAIFRQRRASRAGRKLSTNWEDVKLAPFMNVIFDLAGAPVLFNDLVNLTMTLLQIRDDPPASTDVQSEMGGAVSSSEVDVAWRVESRFFLQRLWQEVRKCRAASEPPCC